MTSDIAVRCKCGRVRGIVHQVSPSTVNHALCYCHDCRAFAHWLEREDTLDAHGGTSIIQFARSRFELKDGIDQVRCLRLGPKGLHRFYADCCRTPLGNTVPSLPFLGVARGAFEVAPEDRDATFGPIMVARAEDAVGGAAPGPQRLVRGILHVARLIAGWALRGLGHPSPLLDRSGKSMFTPRVLTREERQELREHPRA